MKNRMIDVIQDVIKDKKKLYLIGGILAVLLLVIVCVIAGGQEEKKHKSSEEKQGKVTVTEKNDKNKTENEVTSPAVEDDKEQNSENTEASAQAVATPTPAPVSYSEAEGSRKVYLTFDDGTSEQTDKILDILAQYGVKATFFVTAKGGEENAARYRRIVAEGHSIGLHSVSHDYKQVYASLDSYIADVEGIRQFVLNTTGVDSHLYRFPGGSSNSVSAIPMEECIRYLNQNGYRYFDWNIDTSDSVNRNQSVEELVSKALGEGVDKYQYHNSVILMHDSATQSHTVAALPAIIEGLQARGIEMLPITENTPGVQHRKAASVQKLRTQKGTIAMKRVLLKLSGEALAGEKKTGFDETKVTEVAMQVKQIVDNGTQVAIVIGGGNFWRGRTSENIDRTKADQIGMLATVMNCIYVSEIFRSTGMKTEIFTPFECGSFAELFSKDKAVAALEEGCVTFFAGGTGHPYFSTDTATVLRAVEIEAEGILLAKAIDGVYDSDPKLNPQAVKYDEITIEEVVSKKLAVIDLTASIMCMENKMPMLVFGLNEENSIVNTVSGKFTGTKVTV